MISKTSNMQNIEYVKFFDNSPARFSAQAGGSGTLAMVRFSLWFSPVRDDIGELTGLLSSLAPRLQLEQ